MKVNLELNSFKDAILKLNSVVDKRNTRPILTNALFKFSDDGILILYSTDLEVSCKITIKTNCDFNLTLCMNLKGLFEIVSELPEERIELEIDEENNLLKINCLDIHYTLLIINSSEYPQLVFPENLVSFESSNNLILDIINKTSYAIASDETRLFLNGIYLTSYNNKLRAVATDGYRLSMYDSINLSKEIKELENGIIIPKKGIFELKKSLSQFENVNTKVYIDESFIFISIKNIVYSIRLISRDFPNYQNIIPQKTTNKIKIKTQDFIAAMRRVKIMSTTKANAVRLKIKESKIVIEATNTSFGEAKEIIDCQYEGDPTEITLNAKYVMDTLGCFNTENIFLEFLSKKNPFLIRSDEIPFYLSVIMPLVS